MGFVTKFVSLFVKLQQKGYLHRDIKPDNVLTVRDRPGEYKLADFGFAVRTNLYSRDNVAGTHEYVSPKLLAKFINTQLVVPGNTFKDDVYSFGRTLLDMLLLTNGAGLERKLEAMTLYGHNVAHLIQLMLKDSEL